MSNIKAFATAFLEQSASDINKRKDKTEDYEEKQRALAEKNKPLIAQRKQIVGQALGLAKQAKSLYATDAMVGAALDSGPGGLQNLVKQLTEGKAAQGTRWNEQAAKGIVELPEGYTIPGGDLTTRIQKTYGGGAASLGSIEAPDRNIWERITGKRGKEVVRAELDAESFVDGYSIMDVNEAAQEADYQSLTNGTFINYAQPTMFKPEDLTTEAVQIEAMFDRAESSKDYVDLQNQLATLEALKPLPGSAAMDKRTDDIANIKTLMVAAKQNFMTNFVNQRAKSFTGGNYFDVMGSVIDAYLGTGSSASMAGTDPVSVNPISVNTPVDTDPVPNTLDVTASNVEEAGGAISINAPESTVTFSHPDLTSGDVTVKTAVNGVPISAQITIDEMPFTVTGEALGVILNEINSIKPISAGPQLNLENIGKDLSSFSVDEMPQLDPSLTSDEERDALSKKQLKAAGLKYSPIGKLLQHMPDGEERDRRAAAINLKRNADPEAWYKMEVPGMLHRFFKVKGSSLFFIPDTRLAEYGGVVISEFGIDEDLPRKTFTERKVKRSYGTEGADPGVVVSGNEAGGAPEVTESVRPKMRPDSLVSKPEEPATPEAEAASLEAEAVIQKHGYEILNFLKDEGFTNEDTEEDIAQGLADWYSNNSADLSIKAAPMDKGPITYVLKMMLDKE